MSAPRKRKTKRQAAAANAAAVLFYPRSRAPPLAAGGPVPVGQIAATITADGGGRTRFREPNRRDDRGRWRQRPSLLPSAFLFNSFSRKERRGGGRSPFPFPHLSPAAACGKTAAAAGGTCAPSAKDARPSRAKAHLPICNITCKNEKDAPPGRKTYLVTRHPPRTIKNRPPIRAKNAAPLCRTAVIKNKKTGRPIWTSCKFGCGNNLTSRGVIPKYFRRWRA